MSARVVTVLQGGIVTVTVDGHWALSMPTESLDYAHLRHPERDAQPAWWAEHYPRILRELEGVKCMLP